MSWVELLKPEDEVKVEIIWPAKYVEHNTTTMPKYASAIFHLCKAAAILEEDETEFLVWDITAVQVAVIEEVIRRYGVEMTHECGFSSDGSRWTYFYADVRGLQNKMRNGEIK